AAGASRMAHALVPPTPNEVMRARGGVPFAVSGRGPVLTKNGLLAKSILGLGAAKLSEAGSIRGVSASAVLMTPATPEATAVCPMLPFTEPSAQNCLPSV